MHIAIKEHTPTLIVIMPVSSSRRTVTQVQYLFAVDPRCSMLTTANLELRFQTVTFPFNKIPCLILVFCITVCHGNGLSQRSAFCHAHTVGQWLSVSLARLVLRHWSLRKKLVQVFQEPQIIFACLCLCLCVRGGDLILMLMSEPYWKFNSSCRGSASTPIVTKIRRTPDKQTSYIVFNGVQLAL